MSIDINWEKATSGPDGEALAERIRAFIHDKFQQVALPRFIRSVQVHSFEFGTIPPEVEIKDICDPFADFYEEDEDDNVSNASEELSAEQRNQWHARGHHLDPNEHSLPEDIGINQQLRIPTGNDSHPAGLRSPIGLGEHLNSHFLPGAGTPGIPGGTSNLGYHLMSLGGLSGTQTPLAAVAGRSPFANGWPDSITDPNARIKPHGTPGAGIEAVNGSPSRPSTANTTPSRPSQVPSAGSSSNNTSGDPTVGFNEHAASSLPPHHENERVHEGPSIAAQPHRPPRHMRERRPEDFQVICHVKYAGDVKLCLTAEILLDYPMPSFVGLPLKLNITGLTFDGVAVVAYIRRRMHLCFLSPEDADALLGPEEALREREDRSPAAHNHPGAEGVDNRPRGDASASASASAASSRRRFGSLLQHIRVESEIGRKENGKQVLKNVGKVERFVLDQVRRIFEDEFVYPSYWTFLI
ncbi:hypothetical protein VTN96DRAFT_6375 [Rasamsonia emersonii]